MVEEAVLKDADEAGPVAGRGVLKILPAEGFEFFPVGYFVCKNMLRGFIVKLIN